jgi:hypothetical protein
MYQTIVGIPTCLTEWNYWSSRHLRYSKPTLLYQFYHQGKSITTRVLKPRPADMFYVLPAYTFLILYD